jgi:hypothetical protein
LFRASLLRAIEAFRLFFSLLPSTSCIGTRLILSDKQKASWFLLFRPVRLQAPHSLRRGLCPTIGPFLPASESSLLARSKVLLVLEFVPFALSSLAASSLPPDSLTALWPDLNGALRVPVTSLANVSL